MRVSKQIERPLIKANVDNSFWIKEIDANCYHVELTRMTVIPGRPGEPVFNSFVQTFTVADWNRLMQLKEKGQDWEKNSLVHRWRIVHNPLKSK